MKRYQGKCIRVERLGPLRVKMTCPEGHETIFEYKSSRTHVREIDMRFDMWKNGQVILDCEYCNNPAAKQMKILFDDLERMI